MDTKNNGALPLDLACPERLTITIAIQFVIKKQLKI
jgi:hypothetical protein